MKFSLLVPSYNRPDFVRETIQSLLANAAPDVEIIVSDDASPKRHEIRNALANLISKGEIKYIQQEQNLGWSNNRNALVDAAQGEFVVLLGDDDRLKPGAIARLRHWTAQNPGVSIFGFGYHIIDEQGNRVFTHCTPKVVLYDISRGNHWQEIFAYDAVNLWSHHPFTMCSKREVAKTIRYKPSVDIADDAVYLYDALEQGHQFMALPEVLFEWRVATAAGGSYATLSGSQERCHRARGLILAEWLNRPALNHQIELLLRDPKFLARFCMFHEAHAVRLLRLLEVKPADGKALADFISERALAERPSFLRLLDRHVRAIKVMGFGHVLNFMRHKRDKKNLAIKQRKQASRPL